MGGLPIRITMADIGAEMRAKDGDTPEVEEAVGARMSNSGKSERAD